MLSGGTMIAPTDVEKGTIVSGRPSARWRETNSQSLTITSTSPALMAMRVASLLARTTGSSLKPFAASSLLWMIVSTSQLTVPNSSTPIRIVSWARAAGGGKAQQRGDRQDCKSATHFHPPCVLHMRNRRPGSARDDNGSSRASLSEPRDGCQPIGLLGGRIQDGSGRRVAAQASAARARGSMPRDGL